MPKAKLILLAVAVALVTAFAVAWAQRLIMGKTYVAVTAGVATATAMAVMVQASKRPT